MDDPTPDLAAAIERLEGHVDAMRRALVAQDGAAAEAAAQALREGLHAAMVPFAQAQRSGTLSPALHRRLALAGGHVAAQREALARASATLDQTLAVMLPQPEAPAVYSAQGAPSRSSGRVFAAS